MPVPWTLNPKSINPKPWFRLGSDCLSLPPFLEAKTGDATWYRAASGPRHFLTPKMKHVQLLQAYAQSLECIRFGRALSGLICLNEIELQPETLNLKHFLGILEPKKCPHRG